MFRVSSVADVDATLADYHAHRIVDAKDDIIGSPADDAGEMTSLASRCG